MSESHPSPFPTALVLDTSFLRTIGRTGTDSYETFVQYVRTKDRELYLIRSVVTVYRYFAARSGEIRK